MEKLIMGFMHPFLNNPMWSNEPPCGGPGTPYRKCIYSWLDPPTILPQPYSMSCSPGLLWNGIKNECDFPENVNCDLSAGAISKHKVKLLIRHQPVFPGPHRLLHLHDV
jgi:hypothetical protein